jgi:hypothetical protein
MGFGRHLRELARLRLGVALSILLALVAGVWSVARISVLPPGLSSRSLEIATASASVVADTPRSALLDLRQSTYDIEALNNRAVLLGTLMDSTPVRAYVAEHAGVPPAALQVVTPRTPAQPRAALKGGRQQHATDILKAGGDYRLDIEANPTVPILDIYTQAPTEETARKIADSAVAGVQAYLASFANIRGTREIRQIRLEQLGPARGGVINHGIEFQLALVSFIVVLVASCAAVLCLSRIRQGWQLEDRVMAAEG